MTAAVSTHVTIADRVPNSNKCPLKISLVGILQKMLIKIKNRQVSLLETLISDYVSQKHSYNVKVVFPTDNSRFNHLKTTICPHETLIFVVGQMEIIANEFYVYANDINFVSTNFTVKNKEHVSAELLSANPMRSKLLNIHQNVTNEFEGYNPLK